MSRRPVTSPSTSTGGWPGRAISAPSSRSWTAAGAGLTGASGISRRRPRWPSAIPASTTSSLLAIGSIPRAPSATSTWTGCSGLRDQLSKPRRSEHARQGFGGLGASEVEALPAVAVERLQLAQLVVALDPLGRRGQLETVREPDDRGDAGRVLRGAAETGDEGGVDLDRVQPREPLEAAE